MTTTPIYMESHGTGPDLCLLHGWGTHGGIWSDWAQRLASRFRVHVVDLPGHGNSEARETVDLGAMVARVRAGLDAAGVGEAALCGWSLGGLVAMQLALDLPQRVTRLVFIGSTPRFLADTDWPWGVEGHVLDEFARALAGDAAATVQRFLALQAQGGAARDTIRYLRDALASRRLALQPEALQGALAILRDTDLRGRLQELVPPALWIGGQRDVLVRPGAIEWAATHCPRGEAAIVPGAGHAPFISHGPQVLPRVEAFLAHG